MNYFEEMYGKRSPDFIKGMLAGLEAFAWIKDGIYYVGNCGTTLKSAKDEVVIGLAEHIENWDNNNFINPYRRKGK